MPKEEQKNILNLAECEKKLKQTYRVICRGDLIMLFICSVIFIPLSLLPRFIVKGMNDPTALIYVIAVLATLIFVSPILYWIYTVGSDFYHLRLAYTGKFSIVEDDVSWMSEGETQNRHTVNAIYFCRYDRCVVKSATWGITNPGDTFYLLILHTKKPRIIDYFPVKTYQLQKDPNTEQKE